MIYYGGCVEWPMRAFAMLDFFQTETETIFELILIYSRKNEDE